MTHALFLGRFQPLTVAHASTTECILRSWNLLTIGVVYDTPKPEGFDSQWDDLAHREGKSFRAQKNPFTAEEVVKMLKAYGEHCGLSHRLRVEVTRRPYFDAAFNTRFPPESYDLVFPDLSEDDPGSERLRFDVLPLALGRPVLKVKPSFKIHNTEIKKRIREGRGSWSDFIPPGALEIFMQIRGPERLGFAK